MVVTAGAVVVSTVVLSVSVPVPVWATAVGAIDATAAAGASGALLFWTCVPAYAVMPPRLRSVNPTTIARSAATERTNGRGLGGRGACGRLVRVAVDGSIGP